MRVTTEETAAMDDTDRITLGRTAAAGPEVRASVATITSLVGRGPLMLSPVYPSHRPGSALRFLDNGGPELTPPQRRRWVTTTTVDTEHDHACSADVTKGGTLGSLAGALWRQDKTERARIMVRVELALCEIFLQARPRLNP